MARKLFGIEKGIKLFAENGDEKVSVLFGSGLPGGDAGEQDAALVSSLYIREEGGIHYKKTAGSGADKWEALPLFGDLNSIALQGIVKVVTADNITSGVARDLTASPLSDDEAPLLTSADFSLNDLVIVNVGAAPRLMKVTNINGLEVTFTDEADGLTIGDNYKVTYYLPDSPGNQENEALVHYNGSSIIKLGDIDWSFATGINLTGSYTPVVGAVASGDSVEIAIAKLDKRVIDLITLSGVSANATDLGVFTGNIIGDNRTIKQALQDLETFIEELDKSFTSAAITTATVVDQGLVDTYQSMEWELCVSLDSAPATCEFLKITAVHDGHASADAANVQDSSHTKLRIGNTNANFNVILSGAGGAQYMQLQVDAPAGVTVRGRRTGVRF